MRTNYTNDTEVQRKDYKFIALTRTESLQKSSIVYEPKASLLWTWGFLSSQVHPFFKKKKKIINAALRRKLF